MRPTIAALVLAAVLAAVAGALAATRPSVLTAIPAVGTAYWRADCKRERWALGFRLFWASATTTLTFRAGQLRRTRVLQPTEEFWFPFTSEKRQVLHVDQFTEAGTLRAVITLDYGYPSGNTVAHCYAYAPPRVTVQVYPR